MSKSQTPSAWHEFANTWAECCATVLGQVSGRAFSVSRGEVTASPGETSGASAEPSRSFIIQLQKSLAGETALLTDKSSAVMMAQLLMADPPNPEAEFTADYEDALAELIRQFCGALAVALKAIQGEEVPVLLEAMAETAWDAAAAAAFALTDTDGVKVEIRLLGAANLLQTLKSSRLQKAAAAAPTQPGDPAFPVNEPSRKEHPVTFEPDEVSDASAAELADLGLLRDIPLNAYLAFGDHNMPLADVLGCVPGSVIASDRALDMPVELWVEGLLAARGDIVIVDGSYGVRVRELRYSRPRGSSLSRGSILAAS